MLSLYPFDLLIHSASSSVLTLPFLPYGSKVTTSTKEPEVSHDEAVWRGGRVVEGARLLSECTGNTVPRVQIPPSPLFLLDSINHKVLELLFPFQRDVVSVKWDDEGAVSAGQKRSTEGRNGNGRPAEFYAISKRHYLVSA